jgi:hypothetical protein
MTTSRFTNGVTNNTKENILGQLKELDPTINHTYFNDFDTYVAGDWTITTVEAGAGSATEALSDADGGVLLITNDDADDDSDFFNKVGESFKFEAGKKLYFKARLKVSDATQSDFIIGLQITDTTPLDVTDGVFFQKDDGDNNLDFHVEKDNTATTASAIATIADDTYITVGFYYNGTDAVYYYAGTDTKNPTLLGKSATTNLPDDEELTISFGIQNGEAVAKTMSIDYIFVSKER